MQCGQNPALFSDSLFTYTNPLRAGEISEVQHCPLCKFKRDINNKVLIIIFTITIFLEANEMQYSNPKIFVSLRCRKRQMKPKEFV